MQTGQPIGSIESGKWVGRFYAPVGGIVIAPNERLKSDPRLINRDPYGQGWIARIKPGAALRAGDFLHGEGFEAFIRQEIERDQALGE